jgi:hypothetical protein
MKSDPVWKLHGSKVEFLLGGAFGTAGEVEGCRGILSFDKEVFDWAEELGGFFREAGGEKETQDAGIVIAEVDLLAVGEFDGEEVAEVGAEIFERRITSEEDPPAFGPRSVNERVEKSGFLRDAHKIGREVRQLGTLSAFV